MRHNKFGVVLSTLLGLSVAAIIVFLALGNARLQTQIVQLQHDRDLLEAQKVGPQGPAPTNAQVEKAVENYCTAHDECRGPQGIQGATGSVGKSVTGPRGLTGANGDSVASVRCNGTSVLFLDAQGKVLGSVKMVCLG